MRAMQKCFFVILQIEGRLFETKAKTLSTQTPQQMSILAADMKREMSASGGCICQPQNCIVSMGCRWDFSVATEQRKACLLFKKCV